MKRGLIMLLILLALIAPISILSSCDDDDKQGIKEDVSKEEVSDYDMLGTWYAEKKWSIPTQYDYDGFDTYILKEWHSFEANGVLRIKNGFYFKPSETSEKLVPIKENEWWIESCEWSIKGKVLTLTYSTETFTKKIIQDTYTSTTLVNGSPVDMIYSKQKQGKHCGKVLIDRNFTMLYELIMQKKSPI